MLVLTTSPTSAAEPFNYAEQWRTWTPISREAYIAGAYDGIAEAYSTTMVAIALDKLKDPPLPQVRDITDKLFFRSTLYQVDAVATELYRDPSNAFIGTLTILFLSRDKIEGKDITQSLLAARKGAIETHEPNERMRAR